MVEGISGKSRDVVDHYNLNTWFLDATVFKQGLELRPVSRFRGLPLLHELACDLVAFARAILAASFELRRQAQILRLLFRRDSAVEDCAHVCSRGMQDKAL